MREKKINVLYYPDMIVSETTLKKAILLFDELHFMDRPSFTFKSFGSIGAASPLRQYEKSFQEAGVPLFVHALQDGAVRGDLLEQVITDINDPLFLMKFKEGLEASPTFCNFHIPPANYGEAGNEKDVLRKIIGVDLSSIQETHGTAENLLFDDKINPFKLSLPVACAKQLVCLAAVCSAKLNFALTEGVKNDFIPLADATPYMDLLGTRYARAINKLDSTKHHIQISDLSFAIFDELVPTKIIETIDIKDIVRYRKASKKAREDFLDYLSLLQAKQTGVLIDEDYSIRIEKIIKTEIIPAVNTFRNKLQTIDESFFGALGKGVVGCFSASSSFVSIFSQLSWEHIIQFGGPVTGAYILTAAIDRYLKERETKRECSVSYILSLD